MKNDRFREMLKKFTDVWVAYDSVSMKAIATGKSAQAALNRAWKTGHKHPVLIKVPKEQKAQMV